jgi:CheY-like chemotaxis protein
MVTQIGKTVNKHNLQDLILFRVHEILLIASAYDAFVMEEDGGLTEQVLHEYLGMSFGNAPRIWRAETAADAMNMMKVTQFDLVLVMMRISDMDPFTIAKRIKKLKKDIPIILLAFDESELKQFSDDLQGTAIDQVFIWSGNANVFIAIVKQIEDKNNIERDVAIGDVRCIILIEDRPRYYSRILPLIYKEITQNIKRLMDKSLTDSERLLHMRARPKILLATSYEEAQSYFENYQQNTLGIISDIKFPKNGKLETNAGQAFVRWARSIDPSIPILLQSTYKVNAQLADELNVNFVHKRSKTLFHELSDFISTNFGFGDFIFKTPDGNIIDHVTDLEGLKNAILNIPKESLEFHATSNHFSNWLAARGEFILASKIRPLNYRDFKDPNEHRNLMVQLIDDTIELKKESHVVEFAPENVDHKKNFMRICPGSLGGKARGIAFSNSLLNESNLANEFPEIEIHVPKSYVIATAEYDRFMKENKLWDKALQAKTNKQIDRLFQKAILSDSIENALMAIVEMIRYPIAVRSSSLLEDSQYQPLSGAYATYMLPNSNPKKSVRFNQLCAAVKLVYASMFHKEAIALIESSVHSLEEEKMAVIIMELIGQVHEDRFYPTFSGTTQSFNYYPVSYMERNEGVAFVALGLGRTVAEGEKSLRFSPKYPAILPQYYSIKATLANSQNTFYALDLKKNTKILLNNEIDNLDSFDLKIAEKDKTLSWVASVVSNEDNVIRDSLKYKGTRVITFASILKFRLFPLPDILNRLLELGKRALGCEVEIEFAVNLSKKERPEFCILQIKPMVLGVAEELTQEIELTKENIICHSSLTLGNGQFNDIKDIIYVDPKTFKSNQTETIANEIEQLTKKINSKHPYILVGPGRWGTADPWLGIPVKWQQISGAKIIVEVGLPEFPVDPSFGSHFFQNVTSMRLGYFTVNHKLKNDKLDNKWMQGQNIVKKLKFTQWIQTEDPLIIMINGQSGEGHILKPLPVIPELMDEHEATGI